MQSRGVSGGNRVGAKLPVGLPQVKRQIVEYEGGRPNARDDVDRELHVRRQVEDRLAYCRLQFPRDSSRREPWHRSSLRWGRGAAARPATRSCGSSTERLGQPPALAALEADDGVVQLLRRRSAISLAACSPRHAAPRRSCSGRISTSSLVSCSTLCRAASSSRGSPGSGRSSVLERGHGPVVLARHARARGSTPPLVQKPCGLHVDDLEAPGPSAPSATTASAGPSARRGPSDWPGLSTIHPDAVLVPRLACDGTPRCPAPMNVAHEQAAGAEHAVQLEQPGAPALGQVREHRHDPDQVVVLVRRLGSGGSTSLAKAWMGGLRCASSQSTLGTSMSQPRASRRVAASAVKWRSVRPAPQPKSSARLPSKLQSSGRTETRLSFAPGRARRRTGKDPLPRPASHAVRELEGRVRHYRRHRGESRSAVSRPDRAPSIVPASSTVPFALPGARGPGAPAA